MAEYLTCKVCGALIDKVTGETFVSEGSNAHKIKTLQENYKKLQEDFARLLAENEKLRAKMKGEKTDDTDDSGTNSGTDDGEKDDLLDI